MNVLKTIFRRPTQRAEREITQDRKVAELLAEAGAVEAERGAVLDDYRALRDSGDRRRRRWMLQQEVDLVRRTR